MAIENTAPQAPAIAQNGPQLGLVPGDRIIHKAERITLVLRDVLTATGQTRTREVCLHPGAVIILPLLDNGDIVLIRNRRHTVFEELLELPAGTLEKKPDGSPEDPALRAAHELTEETGYQAREIVPFGWFYTSPGILTEKMYAFIARGLVQGTQALEDGEQIKVEVMPPERALTLIHENRIVDAKTIATVLRYLTDEPGGFGKADK